MAQHSTDNPGELVFNLTNDDGAIDYLVELMVDNPKLVNLLDKKFGEHLGDMKADIEELQQRQKDLGDKIDHMQQGIDTLAHNQQMFAEKQDMFGSRTTRAFEKINDRLDSIDGHLSISSKGKAS